MVPDRRRLAVAIYNFFSDFAEAKIESDDHVEAFDKSLREVTTYAAHFLWADRHRGSSNEEQDVALFEQVLKDSGLPEADCEKARNLRRAVMFAASSMLENIARDAEPTNADPGGGMGDPDDREKDDPW